MSQQEGGIRSRGGGLSVDQHSDNERPEALEDDWEG